MDELIKSILENIHISLPDTSLPEPDFVSFWRLVKDRKFYLDSAVDDSVLSIQRQILLINQEDAGFPVNKRKPIMLYIMSPGGDLDYMYVLIDAILTSKTPVYTVNIGMAASAAGLIFMSGAKRFMLPNSKVLIHEGSAVMDGDAGKIMDAADTYKKDLKKMKDFIMAHTEIPKNLLNKKRSNDWTLTAEECITYKVCDKIVDSIEDVL